MGSYEASGGSVGSELPERRVQEAGAYAAERSGGGHGRAGLRAPGRAVSRVTPATGASGGSVGSELLERPFS